MLAQVSVSTRWLVLAGAFAWVGIATACSNSSSASDSSPDAGVDSGLPVVDDAGRADGTSESQEADAGASNFATDAGPAGAEAAAMAYGAAGDAGVLAFCTAFCSFARQCGAESDSGAQNPSSPCDCKPASLPIQRADYVADIASCLAGLDAGACGDASGSASDCVSQAGASLEPSPSAVSFCKADENSACPLRGCLSLVGLYGDPTVEKFPPCLADAGTTGNADGGCDGFEACLSSALTP
jgi:hypothetical protein